jgi:hypothetical protein
MSGKSDASKGNNNNTEEDKKTKDEDKDKEDDYLSITDEELKNYFANVLLGDTDLKKIVQMIQYEGFNPAVTAKVFIARGKKYYKTQGKTGATATKAIKADINRVILVGLTRGTNTSSNGKLINKSGKEGKDLIRNLLKIYLFKKSSNGQYGATDLTIPRVMASFADCTCAIAAKPDLYQSIVDVPEGMSSGLAWPGGASTIPKASEYNGLYELWLTWAIAFDGKIHENDKDYETDAKRVKKYGDIMRGNNFFLDDFRKEIMSTIGQSISE